MIFPPPKTIPAAHVQPPLRPGNGLLMGRNLLGAWLEGTGSSGDFSHPFTVGVFGNACRISRGIIIPEAGSLAREPEIDDVPISGDGGQQPVLKIDPDVVNDAGESWICVEVTPSATGVLDEKSVVEIVQRDAPIITADSPTGRAPLALLNFRNGRTNVFFQIVYFNLRYRLVVPAPGQGARRHYFT